jgi:hypothetical protein
MAVEEYLEILRHGATAWNDWREKNPLKRDPDLSRADLTNTNLMGADLGEANLSRANLRGPISGWRTSLEQTSLLNNQEIRDVIDTITSKAVLILGRFTPERKEVLDGL